MADRISTLPDSLIHHILSFLPTKQAIATSVLSKRWMPLWLAIPALNFDDSRYSRNKECYFRFVQIVFTVMLLRDVEHPIKKFHLKCESHLCDTSAVKTWVFAAIKRKVEHLNLSLCYCGNLPSSVFSSTTLVQLELRGFIVQNSHSSVSFPSLKILHFRDLRFQEHKCLVEILSTCPLLEIEKADVTPHNFFNLTYMELGLRHYQNWNWLIEFLHRCPHLRNLVIYKRYDDSLESTGDEKCVNLPQVVPQCLLSELRNFRQCCYEGDKCEVQFTRFIIQNSRVLRKVTICGMRDVYKVDHWRMINDLSSCRRSSATCELYFE